MPGLLMLRGWGSCQRLGEGSVSVAGLRLASEQLGDARGGCASFNALAMGGFSGVPGIAVLELLAWRQPGEDLPALAVPVCRALETCLWIYN